jgi:hypothetical protein
VQAAEHIAHRTEDERGAIRDLQEGGIDLEESVSERTKIFDSHGG